MDNFSEYVFQSAQNLEDRSDPCVLRLAYEYLVQEYFADQRPWVVAFSGGKDSTVVLQLVYEMLLENRSKARKPVFVVSADTRVEPPNIAEYLNMVLTQIQSHAKAEGIPLTVHLVSPQPKESFWGKLIGKGYPPPTRWFRWCTSSMKIRPSRRIIENIINDYGSVILLLGTLMAESIERKHRMETRQNSMRGMNPHHEIPNALVATPIANWTNDDVWDYLLNHNPPPWGISHDFMTNLYRQASGGECPFILDYLTPSCGGSRFGCWTCTVVKTDLSMKGFIASGETWMTPLYSFRDWLKEIRENPEMRSAKRRNGVEKPGKPGPFTPHARKLILERLFETESVIGKELISDDEIIYIQHEWSNEFDLGEQAIKLANLFSREVKNMKEIELPPKEQEILDNLLAEHEMQPELVNHLLYLVRKGYPSLNVYRAKTALLKEITEAIEKASDMI